MSLKETRYDEYGNAGVIEAPELFAEPENAQIVNPNNGQILVPAQLSGARYLVTKILAEYTADKQDLSWEVLTALFELFRGSQAFGDCLALFDEEHSCRTAPPVAGLAAAHLPVPHRC